MDINIEKTTAAQFIASSVQKAKTPKKSMRISSNKTGTKGAKACRSQSRSYLLNSAAPRQHKGHDRALWSRPEIVDVRWPAPPSLDTFLGALPERPNCYFIHDMTLDFSVQRRNLATELMPEIFRAACGAGHSRIALVAVNGSAPFWSRMAFRRTADESVQELARAKYDTDSIHMEHRL